MREKTRLYRPDSTLSRTVCGQKTTVFVTAAERHGRLRRLASRLFWLLPLTLLGCSPFVIATPIHPPPRPLVPRAASTVQIVATSAPAEPHVDVALLHVEQQDGLQPPDTDDRIRRLREKAAELGCDALYIGQRSEDEGLDPCLDPDAPRLLATCIVFTPPNAAQEPGNESAARQLARLHTPGGAAPAESTSAGLAQTASKSCGLSTSREYRAGAQRSSSPGSR